MKLVDTPHTPLLGKSPLQGKQMEHQRRKKSDVKMITSPATPIHPFFGKILPFAKLAWNSALASFKFRIPLPPPPKCWVILKRDSGEILHCHEEGLK